MRCVYIKLTIDHKEHYNIFLMRLNAILLWNNDGQKAFDQSEVGHAVSLISVLKIIAAHERSVNGDHFTV